MSAKWEKKGTNDGELTFEIDLDKINSGLDQAFKRVRKNLNAPGFRKGKMPRQIFNKMYGETALYEDALNAVLPEAYEAAIKEAAIEPVSQPEISVEKMEQDQPWEIKATVFVKPEVQLGDYKGLEVEKQSRRITIKDIDKYLEDQRQKQAELVLKEDGKAENGDTVVIDYAGSVDGVAFDGGKADNYSLELGSNTFIPGFEDQLVGHAADEDVAVKVTFPKDYQAEELAGKEAVFEVKIHEIKVKQLPELDDEFAKDLDDSVETLDALKEKVREQLKQEKNDAADAAVQDAAIEKATENATIKDLPQAMLDEDVNGQLQQYLANMQQQGINPEMYYQLTGTTEDDLKKQFENDADKRVKTNLVLEAIVKAENIAADDKEIEAEIESLASQYQMDAKAVRGILTDDMLKHDIEVKKAIELITDSAVETK